MPRPCRSSDMPCRVKSHMPCHAPVILRQCRVLRESPCGSRKYPNCQSYSLTDWYASHNNLRGTPRGSRKKPKAGRSPTCRLWTADANSHMPCPRRAHYVPMPRCAVALRSRFQNGMVVAGTGVAWARHGMCETRPQYVFKWERHNLKLASRHGRGTAWERHSMYELVLRPNAGQGLPIHEVSICLLHTTTHHSR
jgi:hypothetical protein